MSLDVIRNLKSEVDALKQEFESVKSTSEELKSLEEKFADLDRKADFSEPTISADKIKEAEEKAVNLKLKSTILNRPVDSFAEYKEVAAIVEKAITPSNISDWLDEKFSGQIIDLMDYDLKVEKLFGTVNVPDGVASLSLPQKTGGSTAYLIQPAQDAVESAITAGKVTFNPVKLKTLITVADEAQNEAVLSAILDVVKADLAYSLAKGSENALVNGDKSGALNGSPSANDVTMAFNGLRYFGSANKVDNGGGAITVDNIRAARKAMGAFGVVPSELVLVVNPTVFYELLNITELQTMDKIGNQAVLKTGTVAMIDGISIVLTDMIPTNLDANGAVDNSTPGTKTAAVLVNTKQFTMAKRNVVEFESMRDIKTDVNIYTARVYRDFQRVSVADNSAVAIVNIG